jgi:hypothetical protein
MQLALLDPSKEIRITKFETNTNFRMTKIQNRLEYCDLGFRICFGFRISCFGF